MAYVLNLQSIAMCMHGSKVQFTGICPRVRVDQQPAILQSMQDVVPSCPNPLEAGGPCVAVQWPRPVASLRVSSLGTPFLLNSSLGSCNPTGVQATVSLTQLRVKAL